MRKFILISLAVFTFVLAGQSSSLGVEKISVEAEGLTHFISMSTSEAGVIFVTWEAGEITLECRSLDGGLTWGPTRELGAPNHPPAPPMPLSPFRDAYLNLSSPQIKFTKPIDFDEDPLKFIVEVSPDDQFNKSTTWVFETRVGSTELTLPIALPDGIYFWRVKAFDGLDYSSLSEPQKFTIDTTRPKVLSVHYKPNVKYETLSIEAIFNEPMDISLTPTLSLEGLSGVKPVLITSSIWQDPTYWQGSFEINAAIPDGTYSLNLDAKDLAQNQIEKTNFYLKIDSRPPEINLFFTSEGAILDNSPITITGKLSEKGLLALNSSLVTPDAQSNFALSCNLNPGENVLTFIITDEAGNETRLIRKITYNSKFPEIKMVKPQPSDWFRNGSAIAVEAEVKDLQNDVADETEGLCELEGSLIYDQTENKLTGFLMLPENLSHGTHQFLIKLPDSKGNIGSTVLNLNIDLAKPVVLPLGKNGSGFSNITDKILIPLMDDGAGPDNELSEIVVTRGTVLIEGMVSSLEGKCFFIPRSSLSDDTYLVKITPRDLAGNAGDQIFCPLNIDTVTPQVILTSSNNTQTENSITFLSGKVNDNTIKTLKVIVNGLLKDEIQVSNGEFGYKLTLNEGENRILVRAEDPAGNIGEASYVIIYQGSELAISNLLNGPNPFNPLTDLSTIIAAQLSGGPADLTLYIFTLTGELIYKTVLLNQSSINIPWDGKNFYGEVVANGVYPYCVVASASGQSVMARGKIIILR